MTTESEAMAKIYRDRVQFALRDPNQWVASMNNLSGIQQSTIVMSAMSGDDFETGRLLREAVRQIVVDDAKDCARDEIEERFGMEPV